MFGKLFQAFELCCQSVDLISLKSESQIVLAWPLATVATLTTYGGLPSNLRARWLVEKQKKISHRPRHRCLFVHCPFEEVDLEWAGKLNTFFVERGYAVVFAQYGFSLRALTDALKRDGMLCESCLPLFH